jgi:hypothetical protein
MRYDPHLFLGCARRAALAEALETVRELLGEIDPRAGA